MIIIIKTNNPELQKDPQTIYGAFIDNYATLYNNIRKIFAGNKHFLQSKSFFIFINGQTKTD